jgi:hypothetical protein
VKPRNKYHLQLQEIKDHVQTMISRPAPDKFTLQVQMITLESYLKDLIAVAAIQGNSDE